jgi:hypothetical protein
MGRNRLFVPQDMLDLWVADQKATVAGTELSLQGDSFDLKPAVLFLRDVSETGDPHGLVGRVKDQVQLASLGAEHYMGSVILGDSAYDVRDGFIGIPHTRGSAATPRGGDIDAAAGAAAGEDATSDEALLTKFLLENL